MVETSNPKEFADLQKLLKSIESLFASPELELILTRIIGLAREVLKADYASIALVDEKGSLTKSVEDFRKVIPLERRARPEGLTMQIIGTKEPVLVHNVETSHRSSNPVLIELGIKSYVGVPLIVDGRVRGVLYAHSLRPRAFARKLSLITAFAGYAAVALKNALLVEKLRTQAIRDSLTQLYNHRYFYERLDEEVKRCRRSHQMFSIIMCDLDNFKAINDLYGHLAGDEILRHLASVLRDRLRSTDIIARYGGDEFAILLPDTDKAGAASVARKIMTSIGSTLYQPTPEISLLLTISTGIATYPSDASSARELLDKADQELFRAKRMGGNQICIYGTHPAVEPGASFQREIQNSFVYALAHAIDLKDRLTYHHSNQVSRFAVEVAKRLNLPKEEIEKTRLAALLHDIGKIGIPDNILDKRDNLTEEEWAVMKRHPEIGAQLLKYIPGFEEIAPVVASTHEYYDGSGYPEGLKGEEIPISARIILVVDTYCAMRSRRPYMGPVSHAETVDYLRNQSGNRFDPKVVEAFLAFFEGRPRD